MTLDFKDVQNQMSLGIVTVDQSCSIVDAVRQIEKERKYEHTMLSFRISAGGSILKNEIDASSREPVSSLRKKFGSSHLTCIQCHYSSSERFRFQVEVDVHLKDYSGRKSKKFTKLFLKLNKHCYGYDVEALLLQQFEFAVTQIKVDGRPILPSDLIIRKIRRRNTRIDVEAIDCVCLCPVRMDRLVVIDVLFVLLVLFGENESWVCGRTKNESIGSKIRIIGKNSCMYLLILEHQKVKTERQEKTVMQKFQKFKRHVLFSLLASLIFLTFPKSCFFFFCFCMVAVSGE